MCRRIGVRVGLPGMEGKHRHLDGECNEHGPEDERLTGRVQAFSEDQKLVDLESGGSNSGSTRVVDVDDADEHQQASTQCVQEELEVDLSSIVLAPDEQDEIDWDQRKLPEDIEQKRIERTEHTHQCRLHQEHEPVEQGGLVEVRFLR